METSQFDFSGEFHTKDIMSLNHSRIISRLCVALDRYDTEYDTFPELELELSTGKCKPDVCIYPNLPTDWYNDTVFFTQAPLIAVEILSPKQALSELTDKAFRQYFPAGVRVVWIIIPLFRTFQVLFPDGGLTILSAQDILRDASPALKSACHRYSGESFRTQTLDRIGQRRLHCLETDRQ